MSLDQLPKTIWWEDDRVRLIDQSRLPLVGDVLECAGYDGVCWAIKGMAVRGAPALGVAGAMAVALFAQNESQHIDETEDLLAAIDNVAEEIVATRPTAVNLAWGVDRMKRVAREHAETMTVQDLRARLVEEVLEMAEEDEARNRAIGQHGLELVPDEAQILTHCNAGSLATVRWGTALGVIFAAHEAGKEPRVWIDETRPVLQGSRLTAWEMMTAGIPARLIADNTAGMIMRAGAVDCVIVGADRIAANGDVANKIGTYSVAVLAKEHGIPFYVAAPTSTVDLTLEEGSLIPIEERDEKELTGIPFAAVYEGEDEKVLEAFELLTEEGPRVIDIGRGHELMIARKDGERVTYQLDGYFRTAPPGIEVFNPAFDVTPAELVTAIITEEGVVQGDDLAGGLRRVCEDSGSIDEPTGE